METRYEVETALGPVWFWGRDTGRPLILVISGAFAVADYLDGTQSHFPDADVLRCHLPGNHCPELTETSLRSYATAYTEALQRRWAGRPTLVLGVSTGGLIALALRSPDLRRLVVVEPPILTEGVWPLASFATQTPPGGEAFVWSVFGVAGDRISPRDHAWILEGLSTPTTVLVGDEPLMPARDYTEMPSLMSEEALARLEDHPQVSLQTVKGAGHNIPRDAGDQLHRAMLWAWAMASRSDAA